MTAGQKPADSSPGQALGASSANFSNSELLILFLTVLLIVGGGLFPHDGVSQKSTIGTITTAAEEIHCLAYNLKKLSYPVSELTDWRTFQSEESGFQFKYPPEGQVKKYNSTKGKRIRVDLPVTEETLLQEKFLLVKVAKVSEENYLTFPKGEPGELVFINRRKFLKKEFEEGAAGHIYEHTIYSTVGGGNRFVLDFILHSVNPGVFDDRPPDFDWKATLVFSKIASTFKLT